MFWDWFSWIASFFAGLRSKEGKVVFLGLDNAGKTTLLNKLKYGKITTATPTEYHSSESLSVAGFTFTAYDLGGHVQACLQQVHSFSARRVWRDYFPAVDAIVFIIDVADVKRIPESASELQNLLGDEMVADCPVLVLGNKIDKYGALSDVELKEKLGINSQLTGKEHCSPNQVRRPLELFMCSIVHNQGFGDGFRWLASYLK